MAEPTQQLIGKEIAGYIVGKVIATGGMATVYQIEALASRQPMLEPLALKVLRSDFIDSPEFVKRFEREAYLLMRLNHPAIVPVYDFGRDDTIMFLVMRLIRGPSLYQLSAQRHWSLQTVCQILQPLSAALDYAHDQGVIHRDIKPGNVLIEPANALKAEPPTQTLDGSQIYLTDFGLSKTHTDTSLTVAGKSMGTPQYMSPEQVMNQPLDRRSDVYALAVLTYEALLGRLPFYGKNAQQVAFKHVTDSVPPPRQFIPRFPALVEAILLRALARNPKDRFPTAGVFSATFSQAVDRLNDAARRTDYWVGPPQTP